MAFLYTAHPRLPSGVRVKGQGRGQHGAFIFVSGTATGAADPCADVRSDRPRNCRSHLLVS
ncbi:hypothetical protein XACJJ10_1090039 [Xanthomonas citri pv. citri]|nr:hypothetical protein XACLG98_3210010 [Xanthomonas citri pv. citri]CEI33835.1 hypothetical protein XACJJ10_1090039 [Xanthomonas citri pv. citri]